MTETLWASAARNYEAAGLLQEAARCHHRAGSLRRAVDLYAELGLHHEAATVLAENGNAVGGAWRLAHHAHDPAAARLMLRRAPGPAGRLLHRLVSARCDLLDGVSETVVTDALDAAQDLLDGGPPDDAQRIESWAVLLAEEIRRPDLVALVFAAAVRGDRQGAAQRWQVWAQRRYGMRIVVAEPAHDVDVVFAGARRWT
ncbi:hypothetical protein ACFO1B_40135 [Dactylosporangium siamense]|uniref:Uncharacterized protein n=1 Tax=Dactylosporangium siamense TaxID=685454 RepID=A0A919UC03_9ACTN|nr:hypothetical protein [Dactylosporangium siamense]GIG50004.1 hypothetical protein Dsi01nite_080450 [Dactylosporangium siamense]